MKKTKEETERTIEGVISIARHHFAASGYANVSLEEIVNEAKLTRGALYHDFKNKEGLFHSVLEEIQMEIGKSVELEASKSDAGRDDQPLPVSG